MDARTSNFPDVMHPQDLDALLDDEDLDPDDVIELSNDDENSGVFGRNLVCPSQRPGMSNFIFQLFMKPFSFIHQSSFLVSFIMFLIYILNTGRTVPPGIDCLFLNYLL